MPTRLVGDDRAVEVDGIVLRAPDLVGAVSVERAGDRATRRGGTRRGGGRRGGTDAIDRALRRQAMRTPKTVRVERARDTPTRSRRGRQAPPPIALEVPAPRPGREQAVLSIDEHGIASWHFAEAPKRGRRGGAPSRKRTYTIPRVAAEGRPAGRRLPGLDKIIKVVTFPIAKAVGEVARFKVREWDVERHPPRIRRFGSDGSLTALDDARWATLEQGRTLLFIHGTFSTTEGAFRALPTATLRELHRRYGGRVIAYDHPTIADDPMANARTFLEQVGNRRLELDIVCHSRGGLVTRSIAERPGDLAALAPNARVDTAVLVAATCNGTILASADNWNELVDRATTLLSFLPAPLAVDALETVFGLVRSIAVQTAKNLEGLDAMVPGGDFLTLLNQQPAAGPFRYRAVVSNFEPKDPGLVAWLNDASRDLLFENLPNDMMVSIDSMIGKDLTGPFPITTSSAFVPGDAIEHADYFGQEKTSKALLEWLTGTP